MSTACCSLLGFSSIMPSLSTMVSLPRMNVVSWPLSISLLLLSLLPSLSFALCSARANALDSASFLAYSVGEIGVWRVQYVALLHQGERMWQRIDLRIPSCRGFRGVWVIVMPEWVFVAPFIRSISNLNNAEISAAETSAVLRIFHVLLRPSQCLFNFLIFVNHKI